jgi:hypothetical protein
MGTLTHIKRDALLDSTIGPPFIWAVPTVGRVINKRSAKDILKGTLYILAVASLVATLAANTRS